MERWKATARGVAGRLEDWRPSRVPHGWIGVLVIVVLGLAVLWVVLSRGIEGEDATWERVVETGVLAVCTDPSWPPFEYVDEATGEIRGFDVSLAREVASRLAPGVRAQIVPVGFDGLYDALLSGRCDAVLSALPHEPMRTQDVTYSVAYFNAGLVIVVPTGTQNVAELTDLAGRVVGVEWGFVPEGDVRQREFLRNLGARRYNTAGDVLRALSAGEVEAAMVDTISALTYARECGGIEIVGKPLHDLNYVVPVRPDSFRLLSEINRVLLEMRKDGSLERLQNAWF